MRQLTPEQATAQLFKTVPALHEEGERAMREGVELTWQRMTELIPHGASGELARDVTHQVRKIGDGVSGLVKPRSKHARFVDQGTGEGKTLRSRHGTAYHAETGLPVSAEHEAGDPFGVMTATGWGAKSGHALALHVRGGVIYRARVRGQRARHFVQRTRDSTHDEVVQLLRDGAERATDRLFA